MCVLFLLTSPLLYPEAMLALVEGRREEGSKGGRERERGGREGGEERGGTR